jgi:hypothetical protein
MTVSAGRQSYETFFSVKVRLHKRDESLGDAIYLKIAIASDGDNMYYIFACVNTSLKADLDFRFQRPMSH